MSLGRSAAELSLIIEVNQSLHYAYVGIYVYI